MKKFKYLFLAIVAMVLCACGTSTEELAEYVKGEVKAYYEKECGTSVFVGDVVLVHKGGNEYESVIELSADGEVCKYSLKVIYDGETCVWETEPLY